MSEDLGARLRSAIAFAEKRDGGKADHVQIHRDGHISVGTRREDLTSALRRAFPTPADPLDPEGPAKVRRGAVQQGDLF